MLAECVAALGGGLLGFSAGFVLALLGRLRRYDKRVDADYRELETRLRKATGELLLIDAIIAREVYGVPPGETAFAANHEAVARAIADLKTRMNP